MSRRAITLRVNGYEEQALRMLRAFYQEPDDKVILKYLFQQDVKRVAQEIEAHKKKVAQEAAAKQEAQAAQPGTTEAPPVEGSAT